MFAYAPGENEKVNAAEKRDVRANHLADGCGEDVEGQNGVSILGVGAVFQSLYITLTTGEREESTFVIDEIFDGISAEFFGSQEIKKNAGVKIAGAGAHGNSAGGGQAHGGIDGNAIAKSAKAGSIAEMREDRAFGKLIAEMMDQGFVRKAVEAVAADASIEITLREGEVRGQFRHGLVKYIVEAGELGRFGKDGLGGCDQRKRLRDMYRREMCGGAKLFQDFWCDLLVGDEMGSTMNDTVANGYGRSVNVLADGFGDDVESMTL